MAVKTPQDSDRIARQPSGIDYHAAYGKQGGTISFHGALEGANHFAGSDIAITSRYHQAPNKLEDDYEWKDEELGKGMNGSVRLMHSKQTGARCALKRFVLEGMSTDDWNSVATELRIFLAMDHPHVARLLDVYESSSSLDLVMECMNGGMLFDRIVALKKYSERKATNVVWQMLLAVNYLHSHDVVHRDLKLENFMYERQETDHLKLIDFGLSRIALDKNDKSMTTSLGTLTYIAPEVLDANYTSQCDLWSLGVIVFILLFGYMPFIGDDATIMKNVRAGIYEKRPISWRRISQSGQNFVQSLLKVDPSVRLTAKQALSHPWIEQRFVKEKDADIIDQRTVDALVGWGSQSKFMRACHSVMAWSLPIEERSKVRESFIAFDTDRTGTIKVHEFRRVVSQFVRNQAETEQAFKALDTNDDDEISYSDFLAAMVHGRIVVNDSLIESTFRHFDKDNSGSITADDLRQVFGDNISEEELQKGMSEVDSNQSGEIFYEEFLKYLRGSMAPEMNADAAAGLSDQKLTLKRDLQDPRALRKDVEASSETTSMMDPYSFFKCCFRRDDRSNGVVIPESPDTGRDNCFSRSPRTDT